MFRILFFLLFLFFIPIALAQHCAFCGSSIVLIQLKTQKGKPINDTTLTLLLQEKNNPVASACTYAEGLQMFLFQDIETSWIKADSNAWETWARERIKETNYTLNKGYYSVLLNQATKNCMLKQENKDFKYIPREYDILIKHGDKVLKKIAVNAKDIYDLCTAHGSWGRIQAISIELKK